MCSLRKMALTRILSAVVLAGALLSLFLLHAYFVTDDCGVRLFLKGEEAFLILDTGHSGAHLSYLEYPIAMLEELLGGVFMGNDRRVSTMVVRVTPSAVQRYVIDFGKETANAPFFLIPFDDGIYAMCPGVVLCKWEGNAFRPATDDEQRQHGGIDHLFRGDTNNQIVNGWSIRTLRNAPGDQFSVEIGQKATIVARNTASSDTQQPKMFVEMLRLGQPGENLYLIDGSPRKVSKSEYERLFPNEHYHINP